LSVLMHSRRFEMSWNTRKGIADKQGDQGAVFKWGLESKGKIHT
jgi:hypothetical protein